MSNTMFRAALIAATTLAGGALLDPAPVAAQVSQASLRGRITAAADNPVQQVTAVQVATGYRATAAITADGSYNFASLRPGTYRLEIRLQNGTRNSDEFTLQVGQNAGLDIDLTTATTPDSPSDQTSRGGSTGAASPTVAEGNGDEIIVTGSRIRSLSGGQVGKNITQRLIEQLPQNNRNFLAFADLAPGVRFVEENDGSSRIQGGAQGSNSVNVFIDGVSQKDYVLRNGITGQDSTSGNPFPQLAIGEYQVLSSNYKAEFDQVSSVAITALTKSGTNEFHGEGFFDYTDQNLRDRRPTELFPTRIAKVNSRQKQFGGALGGPIIKDRMHFFVTYEGKRLDTPYDVRPNNGVSVAALPTQYQDRFGSFSRRFNEDLFFGKIDIVPTDNDLFEFTAKYRDESGSQIGTGFAAPETDTANKVEELRGLARWQHTSDRWINDLRVSYEDVTWGPRPINDGIGRQFETILRNGTNAQRVQLLRIGGGTNFQDKGQTGWTVQDDFTWTGFEGHTIKVGAKAKWVRLNTLEQNVPNALYTYDTSLNGPGGFNDTIPYRLEFGAAIGNTNPAIRSNNFQFGVYAQDDWDVTDRLTLNLGLRWDYERTPAYLDYVTSPEQVAAVSSANYPNLNNADYDISDYISTGNNRKTFKGAFQPRLGFTYRFDEEGRFSMFGGYGRSYDRTQFDFLQQELTQGTYSVRRFEFANANTLNPCTPGSNCIPWNPAYLTPEGRQQLLTATTGGGRELRFVSNDLDVPYSDQFSLGFRSRFNSVELEVGYTHIESRDGFAYLLGNRRPDGSFFFDNPAITTDAPDSPFGFAPPGYGAILIGTNGLETNSDAAYVKLTKTWSAASPWSIDATYTYTQAEENRQFGEYFSLDFPQISDYPVLRSSGVPRHRFVTAGSVDTPIGVTISGRFTIESPQFQKALVSSSAPFERVIIGSQVKSLGDVWGRRQLDLALTKYIPFGFISDLSRIRLRVDIINLMNDRNYVEFNNSPGDTTRVPGSETVYRERVGYGIGGNQPRTIKLSAGFSF